MNMITEAGELYYSTNIKGKNEITFETLPYSDLNIEWRYADASTLNFKSSLLLNNGDRIRYDSTDKSFGGQVYKVSKSLGDLYSYECISYKRLFDTKVIFTAKNMTSKQILTKLLQSNENSFRIDGLKSNSPVKHVTLAWNNKSLWQIIGNLAWLEYKAGHYINYYIDSIGRLVWEDIPSDKEGLSINDVYNYDWKNDSTDLITRAIIINKLNNKSLANVKANNDLLLRWGTITEFGECDIQTTTSKAAATPTSSAKTGSFKKTYQNVKINKFDNKVPAKVNSIVRSICSPKKSDKANLKLIFNWVKGHVGYHYHYNTRHSISSTIKNGKANCCEHGALMVALARAAGIKAQFVHGHNHVWSRHYVNGGWITIDTSSSRGGWGRHLHSSSYGGPPYSYHNTLTF